MDAFRQRKSGRRVSSKARTDDHATSVPTRGLGEALASAEVGPWIALQTETASQAAEVLEAVLAPPAQPLEEPGRAAARTTRARGKRGCRTEGTELPDSPSADGTAEPPKRRSTRTRKDASADVLNGSESAAPASRRKAKGKSAAAPTDGKPAKKKKTAGLTPKKLAELTVGTSHESGIWTKESMQEALQHLCKADAKLAEVIEQHGPSEALWPKEATNIFASLARTIIGQQLAIKAAKAIYDRFLAACKCPPDQRVQPTDVLAVPFEELRACGLSTMKANYITDLARHFESGALSDEIVAGMDYQQLIMDLTKVKGIGRWTVDMFAMFNMGRMDVLPVGDLGVKNGMKRLYNLKEAPSPQEMERLTDAWRPYRSLGSFYMWYIIDGRTESGKMAVKKPAEASNVPL